jgi:regulator of sirC expression with transglutaminase-like and TPR domain
VSAATRERLALILSRADPDPAEANLLVCAEAVDGLDMEGALAHVEGLTGLAREAGVIPALREQGFRGEAAGYDEPARSLLSEVLRTRLGMPIALATLALAVARRVGAPMAGIGMPGHFVLADTAGPEPVYHDPFGGWARLDVADCAALVERTAGVAFRREFLEPVDTRAIVARTLLNLRASYLRRRRLDDALWTVELGLVVWPDDPDLTVGAVTLLAGSGRYDEAEAAARAFLDARPGHPAAAALHERLAAIAHLRRRMN